MNRLELHKIAGSILQNSRKTERVGVAPGAEIKPNRSRAGPPAIRVIPRRGPNLKLSPKMGAVVAAALVVAVVIVGPSCRSSPGTVPVGVYLPLTGPQASFGESTRNGIEMALQEINSGGGIDGKLVEATFLDDEGDPERARDSVQRLIENLGVAVILGGALSGNSLAAAPICQSHGVPMVSPSATNPEVTRAGEFILRVCYVDSFQGTAMATFAYTSLGIKKVAIMSKSGVEYSEGLAEYFARTFESLGGEVVAETYLPENTAWLEGRTNSLLAADPEAVFLPLYYEDVALVARKLAEQRVSLLLLGGDGWDSPELIRLAGDAAEGGYFTTHFSPEDRRTKVRSFVRAYRERFDATPDAIAALGYDAAHLVGAALARLSDEKPRAFTALVWSGKGPGRGAELTEARRELRDMISDTTGFDGVTGEVTIGQSRNALKPAVVLRVEGGSFRYAGVVRP